MKRTVTPHQVERLLQQNPEVEPSYLLAKQCKRFAMAAYYSQHGNQSPLPIFRIIGIGVGLVFTLFIIVLSIPSAHEQTSLDSISFSLESL